MNIHWKCHNCRVLGASGKHCQETSVCPDCNSEMDIIPTVISTAYIDGVWYRDTVVGRACGDWIVHRLHPETERVYSVSMLPDLPAESPVSIRQQRRKRNHKNLRSIAHQ